MALVRSVTVIVLALIVVAPHVDAAESARTRSTAITTSSSVGATTLPKPLLAVGQQRLGMATTRYSVEGRSVAAASHQVDTLTVCEYARPRNTDLRIVHEVRDEAVPRADPRSKMTLWVEYALAPLGPWMRVDTFTVGYNWSFDPLLRRMSKLDMTLMTHAGSGKKRLFLQVRSHSVLEGNIVSFAESLRVEC